MIKTVTFIGAGNMGSRMARRVRLGGFDVTICDASAAVREGFSGAGWPVTGKPSDAAASDVVILLVASDQQIEDVLFGDGGLVSGLRDEAKPILLVMSTTMPANVRSIRDRMAPHGVTVLDSPVSGGLVGAEQGTLAIMMGGDDGDIDSVQPVVKCMGTNIFRCGGVGAGQVSKLINNMIAISNIYVVSEAYALAEKAGVDLDDLGPILEVSTGRTFLSEDIGKTRQQYAAWARDFEAFEALSHITRKDMSLVSKLAAANDMDLAGLKAVSGILEEASPEVYRRWRRLGQLDD